MVKNPLKLTSFPLKSEMGSHYLQDDIFVVYHEFYCPGCATLMCQDVLPPGTPPVWDIEVKV